MKLACLYRAFAVVQGILNECKMHFADLGVLLRQCCEWAIVHDHAGIVCIDVCIESALLHVVVQRIELACQWRAIGRNIGEGKELSNQLGPPFGRHAPNLPRRACDSSGGKVAKLRPAFADARDGFGVDESCVDEAVKVFTRGVVMKPSCLGELGHSLGTVLLKFVEQVDPAERSQRAVIG